jgi:hypothetical protein
MSVHAGGLGRSQRSKQSDSLERTRASEVEGGVTFPRLYPDGEGMLEGE